MHKVKANNISGMRQKTPELRNMQKELSPIKNRQRLTSNRPANYLPDIAKQNISLNRSINEHALKNPQPRQMDYIDRSYMYLGDPVVMTEESLMDARTNKSYQSTSPFNRSVEGRELQDLTLKKAYAEVLKEQMLARTAKKLIDKRNEMEFENKIVNENLFFNKFGNHNKFWAKPNMSVIQPEDWEPPLTNRSYFTVENHETEDQSYSGRRANMMNNSRMTNMSKKPKNINVVNKSFDGYARHSRLPMYQADPAPYFENSDVLEDDISINNSQMSTEIPNNYLSNIMTKKLASMIRGQGRTIVVKERGNPIAEEVSSFIKEVEHRKALGKQVEDRKAQKPNDNSFIMLEKQIEQLKASQKILTQTLRSVVKEKEVVEPDIEPQNHSDEEYNEQDGVDSINDEQTIRKHSPVEAKNFKKQGQSFHTPRTLNKKEKKANQRSQIEPQNTTKPMNRNVIGPNYHRLQADIGKMKDEVQGNQKRIEKQLNEFKELFRRWNSNATNKPQMQSLSSQNRLPTPIKDLETRKPSEEFAMAYEIGNRVRPLGAPSASNKILRRPMVPAANELQIAREKEMRALRQAEAKAAREALEAQEARDRKIQAALEAREAQEAKEDRKRRARAAREAQEAREREARAIRAAKEAKEAQEREARAAREAQEVRDREIWATKEAQEVQEKQHAEVLQKVYEEVLRLRQENELLKRKKSPSLKKLDPQRVKTESPSPEKRRVRSVGIQFHQRGIKHMRTYNLTEAL